MTHLATEDGEGGATEVPGPPEAGEAELQAPQPMEDYSHASVRYPSAAIDALAGGQVVLALRIDEGGIVTDVKLLEGAGYGFDELATELIKSYRFRPGRNARGDAVPTKIGWRMSFAPWRPALDGVQRPPSSGPTGEVVIAPRVETGSEDLPRAVSPPKKPLTREEVEARPIATLSEPERGELCRWQIVVRGGLGRGDRQCPTETSVLQRDVFKSQKRVVQRNPTAYGGVEGRLPAYETRMIRVMPEAVCVAQSQQMNSCGATVGEYMECMRELAKGPCDWKWIPACKKLTDDCGVRP